MELTRTNRSCGLTTYFFRTSARQRVDVGGSRGTHLCFEPRREKVEAIVYVASHHRGLLISDKTPCRHDHELTRARADCRLPKPAMHRTSASFFLAAIPKRSHPFPSRTRKLSSSGPMVLQGQPCGRVGRCRGFEGSVERLGPHSFSAPRSLLAPAQSPSITARALRRFGQERAPGTGGTHDLPAPPLKAVGHRGNDGPQ